MPVLPVPFSARVNKNVDEIETSQNTVDVTDCYFDELGFINRRPGLEVFSTISGAGRIDGIYYWQDNGVTIAVSAGTVYSIDEFGTATSIGSGLLADGAVSFAPATISGSQVLAMANGNGVFTTDGATVSNQSGAPSDADHVAFLDRYLLANDPGTGLVYWSDLNDPTSWPALNFAEAERKPDHISAVHVQGRDLVLFGTRSIEFYYNDGSSPFIRFEGGEVESGVSAPNSIQFVSEINSWFYLNENRHLIQMQNRTPQKISNPYDDEIQDLETTSDCVSNILRVGGRGWYVMNFRTANVTFVYDYQTQAWYKWGNWNAGKSQYDIFVGYVMSYNNDKNIHLVGDINDGLIYSMKNTVYQDNGAEIRSNVRTGFINHGTQNSKKSKRVQFRLKRGIAKDGSDTAGSIFIRFRDDNTGSFGNQLSISTGIGGDSAFNSSIRVGGIYRGRQWDIVSSDNTPFIMGGFEEDVEVLDR